MNIHSFRRILSAHVFIVGLPAVGCAGFAPAPSAADQAFLAGRWTQFSAALVHGDVTSRVTYCASSVRLMTESQPTILGIANVLFYYPHCRELPLFEYLDMRNDRVEQVGRFVYEYTADRRVRLITSL
jgi:hypothetical protein